jgi:hypothetical protein
MLVHIETDNKTTTSSDKGFVMVNTMRANFEGCTKRDIEKAQEARRLHGMIGNPIERDFVGMVREKLIANCPVTVRNIQNANQIFGPDLANLRGKMTRTKPEHVRADYVKIPRDFMELHKYMTIVADVMFVNGLPFLVTSLRGISLVMIKFLPSRTAKPLANSMERVIRIYGRAGFIVQTSMMDMEFEKLRDLLPNVALNTTAAQEHEGEIERKIRVIKERARGTNNTLPYEMLPKLIIIKLMHFCVMWMNSFLVKSGLSEKYSPRELLSRHKLDAKLHCKTPFGAFCEVHTDPDITNTMEPRARWGICLGPTGNLQGSHKFMPLTTGKRIMRCKFAKMPLTDSVKKQVAKWASKDRAIMGLKFMDKYGIEYEFDKEEDAIIKERPIDVVPFPDVPAEVPGIMTQYENLIDGEEVSEDEPVSNDEDQAIMVAENSGLEIGPVNKLRATGEVIELLDDDEVDMLDDNIRHDKEVKMKEEPQQAKITDQDEEDDDEDHANKTDMEQPRRLRRE